ncbi:MAG: LamB/YcsF family protein [Sedimentibacter sp.]|nr:LamB/YcsF family protein [Sedimentibacter sp.]
MYKVDLNSDMGESFGDYKLGMDEEVLKYISSANIACGYHAGDPLTMDLTVKMAVKENAAIGAHPGLPDLMGFGRREMKITAEEAKCYVKYQIGALWAFARSRGHCTGNL